MDARNLTGLLAEVAALRTAPFHEGEAIAYLETFARERGLASARDSFGNLRLDHRPPDAGEAPPILGLSAHMDHPGFEVVGLDEDGLVEARWLGNIHPDCCTGAHVLIAGAPSRPPLRGRVVRVFSARGGTKLESLRIEVDEVPEPGAFGTLDLPDFELAGERAHLRGADDLAGCAAILATLDILARDEEPVPVSAIFTRAEESGFLGALGAMRSSILPAGIPILVVEASLAVHGVQVGGGPVVRVGDRTGVFHPDLCQFLKAVASDIGRRYGDFAWQRALLDGGTCEGTVYGLFDHPVGALSLPLQGYHNVSEDRTHVVPEEIHLGDFLALVTLLVEVCRRVTTDLPSWDAFREPYRKKLLDDSREGLTRLANDDLAGDRGKGMDRKGSGPGTPHSS